MPGIRLLAPASTIWAPFGTCTVLLSPHPLDAVPGDHDALVGHELALFHVDDRDPVEDHGAAGLEVWAFATAGTAAQASALPAHASAATLTTAERRGAQDLRKRSR
jgi:hypothetical protein